MWIEVRNLTYVADVDLIVHIFVLLNDVRRGKLLAVFPLLRRAASWLVQFSHHTSCQAILLKYLGECYFERARVHKSKDSVRIDTVLLAQCDFGEYGHVRGPAREHARL